MSEQLQIEAPRAEAVIQSACLWRLGELEVSEASQRAQWKGRMVPLTLGEFRVLKALITAGRDVSYREIYDALRSPGFRGGRGPDGYKTNVRSVVRRLRNKFRRVDPAFDAIQTYSGFGYRWQAPADGTSAA